MIAFFWPGFFWGAATYIGSRYYLTKVPFFMAPFKVIRYGIFSGVIIELIVYLRKLDRENQCNNESLNEQSNLEKRFNTMRHASDFEGVISESYFKNFYKV